MIQKNTERDANSRFLLLLENQKNFPEYRFGSSRMVIQAMFADWSLFINYYRSNEESLNERHIIKYKICAKFRL